MDIRRKLAVTVAAMVLAGQLGATLPSAAATRTQLVALQTYLAANDLAGLASFVQQNPALVQAGSPLSEILAEFLALFGSTARLAAFPPPLVDEVKITLTQAVVAAMY